MNRDEPHNPAAAPPNAILFEPICSYRGADAAALAYRKSGNHSWWSNTSLNLRSSIPSNNEVKELNCGEKMQVSWTASSVTSVVGFHLETVSIGCPQGLDTSNIQMQKTGAETGFHAEITTRF
jgi:hypothetical protein